VVILNTSSSNAFIQSISEFTRDDKLSLMSSVSLDIVDIELPNACNQVTGSLEAAPTQIIFSRRMILEKE